MFLMKIVGHLIDIYILMIVANAILSWFPTSSRNPLVSFLNGAVEPALLPIRKLLEPIQGGVGIDFSPMALIFLLIFLRGLLMSLAV